MQTSPAPYMRWAKSRPAAEYDLAMSNMVSVTTEELPGLFDGVALDGAIPDGYPPLRDAIARYYGVEENHVALGGGCSGANFLVCAGLLSPGDEVVVERPIYDPLVGAVRLVGGKVYYFERRFEEGWKVDPEVVVSHMTSRTRLVILSSAYNPGGVRVDPYAVFALGEAAAERDGWILVDEAYGALVLDGSESVSAVHAHPRVIITGSFTKSHGLNGLRCGWAVGHPDAIARVRRVRDTVDAVGVYPAEVASARAFDHIDMLEARAHKRVAPNFEMVRAFMASRDELSWVEPDGGTVAFLKLNGVKDATPFVTRLFESFETAVGPGHFFGAPEFFRISFGGDPEDLAGGLDAIARCLDTDAE